MANPDALFPKMVSLNEFAGDDNPRSPEALQDYTYYLTVKRAWIARGALITPEAIHEASPLPSARDMVWCSDILRPAVGDGIDFIFDELPDEATAQQ